LGQLAGHAQGVDLAHVLSSRVLDALEPGGYRCRYPVRIPAYDRAIRQRLRNRRQAEPAIPRNRRLDPTSPTDLGSLVVDLDELSLGIEHRRGTETNRTRDPATREENCIGLPCRDAGYRPG